VGQITGGEAFFSTFTQPNSSVADISFQQCPQADGDTGYLAPCQSWAWAEDGAFMAARSHHTGGVNAAHVDGSVHFYSNGIDLFTWRALGTMAGKEVINASNIP
jgi:hypothetical protein